MGYLTASRIGFAVLLSAVAVLAILRVELSVQLAAMLVGAATLTLLLWPRAPWGGDRALAVLNDRDLMQRERRRGMIAFGLFLVVAVALGSLSGLLIPAA